MAYNNGEASLDLQQQEAKEYTQKSTLVNARPTLSSRPFSALGIPVPLDSAQANAVAWQVVHEFLETDFEVSGLAEMIVVLEVNYNLGSSSCVGASQLHQVARGSVTCHTVAAFGSRPNLNHTWIAYAVCTQAQASKDRDPALRSPCAVCQGGVVT